MEVAVHFSYVCTWVAVGKGTIVYVRGLQWEQSCMYVGCSKVNHVHPYKVSGQEQVVQADVNNSTGDVNRSYRWSATDL
jgi:hypothetical protein